MSKHPEEQHPEDVASNCDWQINREVEKTLKENPKLWAGYPAYNFHGQVWYDPDDGQWYCEVWTYGSLYETVAAGSVEDLMKIVSETHGRR